MLALVITVSAISHPKQIYVTSGKTNLFASSSDKKPYKRSNQSGKSAHNSKQSSIGSGSNDKQILANTISTDSSSGLLILTHFKPGESKSVLKQNSNRSVSVGNFIVGLFCYICSFLFFMWLFAFTYALLAGLRFTLAEDRFFNTLRLLFLSK
jgi:hypothetical protein